MILLDDKVFDDQNVRQYTTDLTFSPDSRHLAYVTRFDSPTNTGYNSLVLDGAVQNESTNVFTAPYFSPDGRRLAYLVRWDHKESLHYGEFKSAEYDRLITCIPDLSDRKVMARMNVPFAIDGSGTLHSIVLRSNEILRVEFKISDD
jgi:hypothetical protein